jgi:tungstate transport system substrate-binding protein
VAAITVLTVLTPIKIVPTLTMPLSRGDVVLSTTAALGDSGLLGVLVPLFEERTGYRVRMVATNVERALALAATGDADVVLAHVPGLERPYVAEGRLLRRRLVMYDEFVIVGPSEDPAGIRGMNTVAQAMRAIAMRRAQFVSRADDSGTHAVERDSWSRAGVAPGGDWYIEARRGMSGTLGLADAWNAYTLADRGTYVAWRRRTSLSVLLDGERSLRKIYCVLEANAGNGPNVDPVAGNAFAEFILSDEAQDVIRTFGRTTYGEPLFAAAAGLEDSDVTGSD